MEMPRPLRAWATSPRRGHQAQRRACPGPRTARTATSCETRSGTSCEARLQELWPRPSSCWRRTAAFVLAIAHALETHKTITGEDIDAIFEGTPGPDARRLGVPRATTSCSPYEAYHERPRRPPDPGASVAVALPAVARSPDARSAPATVPWAPPTVRAGTAIAQRARPNGRWPRATGWARPPPRRPSHDRAGQPEHRAGVSLHLFCKPTPRLDAEAVVAAVKASRGGRPPGRDGRRCSATRPTSPSWRSAPTCASCAGSRRALQAAGLDGRRLVRLAHRGERVRQGHARGDEARPGSTRSCRPRASRRSASTRCRKRREVAAELVSRCPTTSARS